MWRCRARTQAVKGLLKEALKSEERASRFGFFEQTGKTFIGMVEWIYAAVSVGARAMLAGEKPIACPRALFPAR
jgi:hypothetical protein